MVRGDGLFAYPFMISPSGYVRYFSHSLARRFINNMHSSLSILFRRGLFSLIAETLGTPPNSSAVCIPGLIFTPLLFMHLLNPKGYRHTAFVSVVNTLGPGLVGIMGEREGEIRCGLTQASCDSRAKPLHSRGTFLSCYNIEVE